MPSPRAPLLRRPVSVVLMVLLGLGGLLGSWSIPPAISAAFASSPYAIDTGLALTVPTEATFVVGRAGDAYEIEALGDPVPAIGVDRLPAGLRLTTHGDGSATIEGTPTGPVGTTTVEVRAQNASGTSIATFPVVIQQAPAFIDRGPVVLGLGELSSVVLHTVGYPVPGISIDGDLPPGLSFVDNGDGTATVSGRPSGGPTAAPVTLTAVNVVADASLTTTIEVATRATSAPAAPLPVGGPRREP